MRIMNLMPKWIESSMKQSSHYLMNKKLEVLQQFSSALRRQLSFMQLVKVNVFYDFILIFSNVSLRLSEMRYNFSIEEIIVVNHLL